METRSHTISPLVTPEILSAELRRQDARVGAMLVVATGVILAAMAVAASAIIQAVGGEGARSRQLSGPRLRSRNGRSSASRTSRFRTSRYARSRRSTSPSSPPASAARP